MPDSQEHQSRNFDPRKYGPHCASLIAAADLCPLGPGVENSAVQAELTRLDTMAIFPDGRIGDEQMAASCLSGLWLLHNFLDRSHAISQDIDTPTGSFWHGIMHRREPDYSNAKYWFRRTGEHPVFESLAPRVSDALREGPAEVRGVADEFPTGSGAWDPERFVDLCQRAADKGDSELQLACRIAAREEWRALFDYCYEEARG